MLLDKYFKKFKREAFRLELLDFYDVKEERKSFENFKRGKIKIGKIYLKELKILKKQNKNIIRIHIVPKKLTSYLKFEIVTGYLPQEKYGVKVFLINKSNYNKINNTIFY